MIYIVVFFTSLVLTLFFTPSLIDFITSIKVVDMPGDIRRVNTSPVPRMGGIIIYVVVLIMTISFYEDLDSIRFFILASGLIALLGIVDDMIGVHWNHKFIIQFLMSFFLIYFLSQKFDVVSFFGFQLAFPLNYIFLTLLIVGVINSINLLDGLDGLVSGFSLLVVFVTFLVGFYSGNTLLLILTSSLMGALVGFLRFNAFPARIFLGDTGSYTMGFFLISTTLIAGIDSNTRNLDLTFAVILLSLPILDTVRVMVFRLLNKRNLFLADRSHIHHILLEKIPSHKFTVFIIESIALLFAALSIYYLFADRLAALVIYTILTVPVLFIPYLIKTVKEPFYPGFLKTMKNHFPQTFINVYIRYIIPLTSILVLAVLIGLAPERSNTSDSVILLSILFVILLFVYSLTGYQKNKYLNDILVFFNLILFLLYSNYAPKIYSLLNISGLGEMNPMSLLIILLLPSVLFFIFFREKMFREKITLFSGIDLIILVFIMLLSVSSSLLPGTQFANANIVLFHSYLLYIFYKVFVLLKKKYRPQVFYLSFAIPVVFLIRLLMI